MANSKVNAEDAQEWLESLQQVGEGWYRQVGLAIKANAPKALGMERREFAAKVGQSMGRSSLVEQQKAVVELREQGLSQNAIADILGIDQTSVAGYLEVAGAPGSSTGEIAGAPGDVVDGTATEVLPLSKDERWEKVAAMLDEDDWKDGWTDGTMAQELGVSPSTVAKDRRAILTQRKRDKRDHEEASKSDADREREQRENEAWVDRIIDPIRSGLAPLAAQGIVGLLEEAAEAARKMINDGGITVEMIEEIDQAHAAFTEELNVARATASSESRTR